MRLRLVRTAAETDGDLLEMEATYEPGSVEPLEHFHPHQDEHFEILTGTIEAQIGGERQTLRAGDAVDIPAGTVHAMWNGGDDEARVNWETRPALRSEEFFRTIGALARAGKLTPRGAKDTLAGAAVMQEFRDEFRPTTPPALVQAVGFPVFSVVAPCWGADRRAAYPTCQVGFSPDAVFDEGRVRRAPDD
jgi:mannose-6-phosphate isomerase-like protein (cupin superfamily)